MIRRGSCQSFDICLTGDVISKESIKKRVDNGSKEVCTLCCVLRGRLLPQTLRHLAAPARALHLVVANVIIASIPCAPKGS